MKRLFALTLILSACGHTDAFVGDEPPAATEPFGLSVPARLTFDAGMDQFPSWSPDGRSIAFSFQPMGRPDYDRCIGILPSTGGTRRDICYTAADGNNRSDALEWPAIGPDGSLLYTQYYSDVGTRLTDGGALRLATVADPLPGRILLTIPNVIGPINFNNIGTTRWATATRFYFIPQSGLSRGSHANPNKKDTMFVGVGIARGDLVDGQAVFSMIVGTDSASGFDFSRNGDSLYFTRQHEPHLYVVPSSGGSATRLYTATDAGDMWSLRNPTRVGDRIAVVFAKWDLVTGVNGVPPRGLIPGSRLELIRPGTPGSEIVYTPTPGNGLGAIAAAPDRCELVIEVRRPQQLSFTTDLYSLCLGQGGSCSCP